MHKPLLITTRTLKHISLARKERTMRLLRVEHAARRTVIYHPSLEDVWNRLRCLVGRHEYLTVLEYPSVGAKEEMCLHCLKERYLLARPAVPAARSFEV